MLVVATSLLVPLQGSRAASLTWDASTANGTSPTNPLDGSGIWFTSGSHLTWSNGSTDALWANANNDTAVFGDKNGAAGTVTLNIAITVGGITFNPPGSGSYTLTSNFITLAGANPTISVNGSGLSSTINSGLAGSSGLIKSGAGTLVLGHANTYTGGTAINGGTLELNFVAAAANNVIPSTSSVTLAGATLLTQGDGAGARTQTFGGLTVNAGGSAVQVAQTSGTNIRLDLGAINRNDGGTVDFALPTGTQGSSNGIRTTSTNAFFSGGAATILGDFATVGGSTWAVSAGTGAAEGNITGLATASYTAVTTTGTFGAAAADVDFTSGGGNYNFATGLTFNSFRDNVASHNVIAKLGTGTTIIATGGILQTAAANLSFTMQNGTITSGNGQDLIVSQNSTASMIISSVIANNGGTSIGLTKSGPGPLTLTGANSYTGGTIINSGTVQVGNAGTTGALGSGGITNNGALVYNLTNTLIENNAITGSGSVTQAGAGTTTFASSNGYTGATFVNAGEVIVSGSLTGTINVSVLSGAILNVNGSVNPASTTSLNGILSGTGQIGAVTVNSGGILSPGNGLGVLTTGSTKLLGGGSYNLALNNDGSSGSAGANWDQVAAGTLDISGLASGTPFVLTLQTLNSSNANGALASFDASQNHTWTSIVTFTGLTGAFASNLFSVNTTNFLNATDGGTFSVVLDGNALDLQFQAVPEPGTLAMILAGFGMFAGLRRTRRHIGIRQS